MERGSTGREVGGRLGASPVRGRGAPLGRRQSWEGRFEVSGHAQGAANPAERGKYRAAVLPRNGEALIAQHLRRNGGGAHDCVRGQYNAKPRPGASPDLSLSDYGLSSVLQTAICR